MLMNKIQNSMEIYPHGYQMSGIMGIKLTANELWKDWNLIKI